MNFIERQFPLLSWIMKAREARFFAKGFFAALSQTRKSRLTARELNLQVATDAGNQPDIAALQFQLGMTKNVQFLPLNKNVDSIPLAENEVLFVPVSLAANRYITFYNSGYLIQDIENFVDPKGVQNTRSFKSAPCWGRCKVYRSNHPDIQEGSTYYGFWPLAAYCVRSVCDVDDQAFVAYLNLPTFSGPKEWLKLIKMEDDSNAMDNYEYMKIGITYARELEDMNYFDAERLVISSASSASGQIIAMCLKELNPSFTVIGLTSERNLEFVKQFSYFDEVYPYDEIKSGPNANKSLYFDALGWESVTKDVFEHFEISRWWIYGEGGDRTFFKYLKKNRKGTLYSNLADSYIYQIRSGITDNEMLEQCRSMINKYDLEKQWYTGVRKVSKSKDLFDLYQAYVNNAHSGEKVVYQSPVLAES
jgi:hypothetical protein|tara:strand:- start:111 stop:1370 length:1260 start_codon:yes stop_codon:yes gene_type:complete